MDAVKYLKEKRRMCANTACSECPFNNNNNGVNTSCSNFEQKHTEKAVEALEKWSKKNPQKTILQDFLEKYPNAPLIDGRPEVCPSSMGYVKAEECCYEDCNWCWNRPLEG